MTLIQRLRSFLSQATPPPLSAMSFPAPASTPAFRQSFLANGSESAPVLSIMPSLFGKREPLPDWLADDESLRDEGVLFGLSGARPDGKLTQIRAAFALQTAPLQKSIEYYTEKIAELNLFIEQSENHLISLRDQITHLRNSQLTPDNLIRTVISLCLSVLMCIGTFCLIDASLRPSFPNRWITAGVFMAGMFNLFGHLSFFYETDSRLSGRRIIEEVGLPLATSIFILVHSLQTQSVGLAIGLFIFVFFLFLLAGKLLLSTLTSLQSDLAIIQKNRQLTVRKEQTIPAWENEIERLDREIDMIRAQKWPVVTALSHTEVDLNQLNAQRDRLANLFLSEFELARSLRERLTEQQLKSMINYGQEFNS